ncbi:hypothetical protein [Roseomonas elaeocarpi]|uniref:Uncharacterized protein n=1 Tax=Roseomonas elaeocarpi TaxID=907779 RepID=A0ABV6JTP3_9PROT
MRPILALLLLLAPLAAAAQEAPRRDATPPASGSADCGCGSGTQAGGPR